MVVHHPHLLSGDLQAAASLMQMGQGDAGGIAIHTSLSKRRERMADCISMLQRTDGPAEGRVSAESSRAKHHVHSRPQAHRSRGKGSPTLFGPQACNPSTTGSLRGGQRRRGKPCTNVQAILSARSKGGVRLHTGWCRSGGTTGNPTEVLRTSNPSTRDRCSAEPSEGASTKSQP